MIGISSGGYFDHIVEVFSAMANLKVQEYKVILRVDVIEFWRYNYKAGRRSLENIA
ncbi:hypothetical protein [Rhodohalobacter sp. SW132]|uniref:hypothetical protein n=1 Tax=Rhodohalobacter sp. SW132 TaxID=2293433 RepID=UPI001314FF3C|nr:hypothetical protein [Rhodohalobacter sp. SW132]